MIKLKRMRLAGHVVYVVETQNVCRAFVGKPEGKRLLERPKLRREDKIEMNPKEIGGEGMNLVLLTMDRNKWLALVNTTKQLQV
jgi:hypothetical protein